MVKTSKLMPTLRANHYELTMDNRPSDIYKVWKDKDLIGKIKVNAPVVEANTGTEISFVVYDIDIEVIECTEELPIKMFKKMIKATVIVS